MMLLRTNVMLSTLYLFIFAVLFVICEDASTYFTFWDTILGPMLYAKLTVKIEASKRSTYLLVSNRLRGCIL